MKEKVEGNKAEKRSISMPKWLWTEVDYQSVMKGDNLSRTVQELIKKALKIKNKPTHE